MHQHGLLLWGIFTGCGLFAIVYKAVMSAGSELTPFKTTIDYLHAKSITTAMRFLIAQFAYFFILDNPALIGDLFAGAEIGSKLKFAPLVLAGMLGLASDKVADVVIAAGTWVYRKLERLFGGKDKADGASA